MQSLRFLTAGESHGKGLLVIVEGMPAGLALSEAYIAGHMQRRQGGYGRGKRQQIEQDAAEIVSGVRHGLTMGTPIGLRIENKDWNNANWQKRMAVDPVDEEIEKLMEEKLVLVSTPRKRGKDAGGYVYVDWGPEFAAHHNLAFPDRDNPATYVGLGPLGLQLVLKDGGSGYFRHHAVEPHLRAGRLELVRGAPEFLYPAYAVYSESPDDPKVVEPALAGLRSVAAALQPSARSRPRAKARK